jgi:hypothetical protein
VTPVLAGALLGAIILLPADGLSGSVDGELWTAADSSATIAVPRAALVALVPGDHRRVTIWVRNETPRDLTVTSEVVTEGPLFTGTGVAVVSVPDLVGLAPGEVREVPVDVRTPAWRDREHLGDSGTVTVRFTANDDVAEQRGATALAYTGADRPAAVALASVGVLLIAAGSAAIGARRRREPRA